MMTAQSAIHSTETTDLGELYFCPNGHEAELFTRKALPPEKRKIIKQLYQLDKRWNWVIPFHLSLWLGSGFVAVLTPYVWLDILCICIGAIGMSGLAVIVHEAGHFLFTHKKIDRWIGFLCGLPILLPARTYRLSHLMHHKFVRSERDPDDLENMSSQARWLPYLYILMLFLGAYLYIVHVPISAWKNSPRERISILTETLAVWLFVIGGWLLLPVNIMIQAWLLPLMLAAQILNVRGIAEHGLTSTGNEFVDSRTVISNRLVSFLSLNINYHLEHHLYPGIPWYNLPMVHALLWEEFQRAGASVYRSYTEFLLDFFKVLWEGVRFGRRLIPEYLREQLCI